MVVTIVGTKYEEDFEWILSDLRIKTVNTVNSGMFGNFSTITYFLDIPEDGRIEMRRKLMNLVRQRIPSAMALYEHGDWNRIYIMKRFRIENNF